MPPTSKQIRDFVAERLERAAAGHQAQLAEKGSRVEETIRADQTTRVLDDVLRFIEKGD